MEHLFLICSDISYLCEFNPPPLFENALEIKLKGKFCYQAQILKSTPSTKSGGG